MPTEVRWLTSTLASAFHAAKRLSAGAPLTDPAAQECLETPARELVATLETASIPVATFFEHVTPLSVGIVNPRELADVALTKTVGQQRKDAVRDDVFRRVQAVQKAWTSAMPELADQLALRSRPLREQWEARGPGLLHLIGRQTTPQLLPERVDVVLIHPVAGGAGRAYVQYNSVHIEAVLANPHADLPEVVRLAWLISKVELDRAQFSESISRARLASIAGWAMLPPVLAASTEVELTRNSGDMLARAIDAWEVERPPGVDLTTVIASWWETYSASRPAWSVALSALEQMTRSES